MTDSNAKSEYEKMILLSRFQLVDTVLMSFDISMGIIYTIMDMLNEKMVAKISTVVHLILLWELYKPQAL